VREDSVSKSFIKFIKTFVKSTKKSLLDNRENLLFQKKFYEIKKTSVQNEKKVSNRKIEG
jgi:hypothetical protein